MPKCWQIDLNVKKPHRMHQNSPFWDPQSKNFLGRGHCPLPRPLPQWGGETPSPHPTPSAPMAPRFSRLRNSTSAPLAPRSMVAPQCWIEIDAHDTYCLLLDHALRVSCCLFLLFVCLHSSLLRIKLVDLLYVKIRKQKQNITAAFITVNLL